MSLEQEHQRTQAVFDQVEKTLDCLAAMSASQVQQHRKQQLLHQHQQQIEQQTTEEATSAAAADTAVSTEEAGQLHTLQNLVGEQLAALLESHHVSEQEYADFMYARGLSYNNHAASNAANSTTHISAQDALRADTLARNTKTSFRTLSRFLRDHPHVAQNLRSLERSSTLSWVQAVQGVQAYMRQCRDVLDQLMEDGQPLNLGSRIKVLSEVKQKLAAHRIDLNNELSQLRSKQGLLVSSSSAQIEALMHDIDSVYSRISRVRDSLEKNAEDESKRSLAQHEQDVKSLTHEIERVQKLLDETADSHTSEEQAIMKKCNVLERQIDAKVNLYDSKMLEYTDKHQTLSQLYENESRRLVEVEEKVAALVAEREAWEAEQHRIRMEKAEMLRLSHCAKVIQRVWTSYRLQKLAKAKKSKKKKKKNSK
jgi:hypothetical protein